MRAGLVSYLSLLGALSTADAVALADSRVSFELGGVYSSSPMGEPPDSRRISSAGGQSAPGGAVTDGIVGVELRPSFLVAGGMRIAVGFRSGESRAEVPGTSRVSLVGGDVSLGYGPTVGWLLPFGELRFGFNSYDTIFGVTNTRTDQLRLDGVLGARLYFSSAMYLVGSVFAGYGDRYGGTLGLGLDVVRYRYRGNLPSGR